MKNVIIYGLGETEGEDVQSKVEHVLADIGENPFTQDCSRLGSRKEGAVRPIKFTVESTDHAAQVIRKARNLRTMVGYTSVYKYISPDRTLEERRAYRQLVDQIKMKNVAEPNC